MKGIKIFFTAFVFFFLCRLSFSQDSTFIQRLPENRMVLMGEFFYNSNTITNEFIRAFYSGKYLDSELKQDATARAQEQNRLGAGSRAGLTFARTRFTFRGNKTFSFSFFDRQHLDISFTNDLWHTFLYGNKMFEGDTAHWGNFRLNLLRWQQFRFGWEKSGDLFHGAYGFAVSLLSGEQNYYLNASTLGIYTAPQGAYLSFPLELDIFQTDTARKKYFAQNGMGLSADFFYEMPYTVWRKAGKIIFKIEDFGFIRWSSNSIHYAVDSFFYFDGVEVADVFQWNSPSFSDFSAENLVSKNSGVSKDFYHTLIPSFLEVNTRTVYTKQISFEKGFRYFYNASAVPYFYAKLFFGIPRRPAAFAYLIGYGGYGKFHAGLEFEATIAKKYSFHFTHNFLFSSLGANSTYGKGLQIKLSRKF